MGEAVAFLGLGVMGFPMAGHLARAGHDVSVYNRTASKAERWVAQHGGQAAPTPGEAARDARFVLACVGNDSDVRAVTLGHAGAFSTMARGSIFVDHTTTSADLARELAAAARARGIGFVDAPVSGGQTGAQNGTLTVMAGGDLEAFDSVRTLLAAYAKFTRRIGPAGCGQLAKMVNQICIAGLVQALAEGLAFAKAVGLDAPAVVEVISKGAAGSWQMENRAATMLEGRFDFGFAVDWMRKDLGFALEEARRAGAFLPVTTLVDQFYAEVQAMGRGRWDTSSLMTRLVSPEPAPGPGRSDRVRGST
jgi:3-hydroxyisobutyrate dehydrogenase-like beta-hydroxyacid dehydrogenase